MPKNRMDRLLNSGMKLGKDSKLLGYIEYHHPNWVEIGEKVVFGVEGRIITHGPIRPFRKNPKIIIEDLVWIGFRCIILPGVRIGKCSIIGAGSVVTKDVPAYHIAAGNPIRILRKRDKEEIERFYVTKWILNESPGKILNPNMSLLTQEHKNYIFGVNNEDFDSIMDYSKT